MKNYTYTFVDGKLYYRENSVMYRKELSATAEERIRGMDAKMHPVRLRHDLALPLLQEYDVACDIGSRTVPESCIGKADCATGKIRFP